MHGVVGSFSKEVYHSSKQLAVKAACNPTFRCKNKPFYTRFSWFFPSVWVSWLATQLNFIRWSSF